MGTRSLTRIFDQDEEVACIYRQFDGYPTGHGAELTKMLAGRTETNGISDMNSRTFNGMGDLAAFVVMTLKQETPLGGIYLYPAGSTAEEYVYEVRSQGIGRETKISVGGHDGLMWEGTASAFDGKAIESGVRS